MYHATEIVYFMSYLKMIRLGFVLLLLSMLLACSKLTPEQVVGEWRTDTMDATVDRGFKYQLSFSFRQQKDKLKAVIKELGEDGKVQSQKAVFNVKLQGNKVVFSTQERGRNSEVYNDDYSAEAKGDELHFTLTSNKPEGVQTMSFVARKQ